MHRLRVEKLVVAHLVRRFFGFLRAKPLTPTEQQHVRERLRPDLAAAFFAQRIEDQRHALNVEIRVGSLACSEAALLHDIGKTESDLGAVSRSAATIWRSLGFSTTGRWQSYLEHNVTGAETLAGLGAGRLAVSFTRHHPGTCPDGIDPVIWQALEDADNA